MINYDSIISAYNDKPTLMEWLKKVEEALKGASATSFSVNKKGNATISFQIDFDDGTSLESGDIILQQGESVTGASIVNGHLILTLSNGDNLDAGNLGAVSSFSIDRSQHLIVTYQDGTTNDLGAIFNGNVNISGVLTASSVSTPLVTSAGASVEFAKPIDVDVLTSSEGSITTQKPILESLAGYTYDDTARNSDYVPSYVGITKNGNKLTFVFFGSLTPTEIGATRALGRVYIPNAVNEKLITYSLDGVDNLDNNVIQGFAGGMALYKDFPVRLTRGGGIHGALYPFVYIPSEAVLNTTYLIRYEVTLLLSENLAA